MMNGSGKHVEPRETVSKEMKRCARKREVGHLWRLGELKWMGQGHGMGKRKGEPDNIFFKTAVYFTLVT